ncbi:MAG: ATP-binding cassette domain-containing protein [Clostridiales bacterium]|nr:ATP-binding cassette domain-containing protein [Clostridiales bacterium]
MAIKFLEVNYKNIFENLNIDINKNQITSLIGKNGSGKTLLLNLIYGLDQNFEGKITIGRKSFNSKTKTKHISEINSNILYLIQDYQKQLFNINILEDIKYSLNKININELEELLKGFGLSESILKKNYLELSDSEKKKVLLVKIFINNSKIILLDDPTTGLDQKSISTLIKLLKKEKRKEKIIIISSQDSEFLLNVSDEILIIKDKKIIKCNDKYKVFGDESILDYCGLDMPSVLKFRKKVLEKKNLKLVYRDNINDLLKDIYRNVK